ncbi:MAG: 2-oxoacid:acceptor oxidoreductase family protein, partial [Dehalococcoidia bacterium]
MAKATVMVGGVGGQGSLLFGQMLAKSGLARYKYATYFPNYGGLMRGGASECTVSLSNDPVNSPIVLRPDAAVAMNPGYFSDFERRLKPGGTLFVDSSVVPNKATRDDIKVYSIPAT